MALTTVAGAKTQYAANHDYEDTADVAKAKLFRGALVYLVGLRPEEIDNDGDGTTFNVPALQSELSYVRSWIVSNDSTATTGRASSRVRHMGFREFRT